MYNLSPCLSLSNEFYIASISIKLDKIFVSNHDIQTNNNKNKNDDKKAKREKEHKLYSSDRRHSTDRTYKSYK